MLRSCKYCGRVHDDKIMCLQKKKAEEKRWANRKETDALRFRKSQSWKDKSLQIRQRDQFLCLCCKAQLVGTVTKYNTKDLSVHHIVPINEDYYSRLDDENLITVCMEHHELCESETISRDQQRALVLSSIRGEEKEIGAVVY